MTDPTLHLDARSDPESTTRRLPAWLIETPYWAISAVVHLVILLFLAGAVILEIRPPRVDRMVVRAVLPPKAPPNYRPEVPRELDRQFDPEQVREKTQVKIKPDIETPKPRGQVDAPTHVNITLDPFAASDELGILGRAAAKGGTPDGVGSAADRPGRLSESAVLAALHWLRRQQHPDGHWSSHDFVERCHEPSAPCSHAGEHFTDDRGWPEHDVGVTGLALLAFLGHAHTHVSGEHREFRPVVRRARDWLLAQQDRAGGPRTRGRFGPATGEQWMYDHAIATQALAELLLMTRDFKLRKPVDAATRLCLAYQTPGFGWRYGFHEGSDSSVTGWMMLTLKAARACAKMNLIQLDAERFEPAFEGALAWFRSATGASGRVGYLAPGDPGSSLQGIYPEPYPYSKKLSCMTAVAVLGRLFAGESHRSPEVRRGIALLMAEPPRWAPGGGKRPSRINLYYWYYASYALFQHGGRPWSEWNEALLEALCPTQRQGGCEDGSWDPMGEWGAAGGRVYATAIGAMTLEVYYRYRRTKRG